MVSRVNDTWCRECGVHSFEGTEVRGYGYVVSHYPFDAVSDLNLSISGDLSNSQSNENNSTGLHRSPQVSTGLYRSLQVSRGL